jgi:hypothetical protein
MGGRARARAASIEAEFAQHFVIPELRFQETPGSGPGKA